MFLYQTRTLIMQVSGVENPSIDHLIHGFQEKLDKYKKEIEGIRYCNYKKVNFWSHLS